MKEIKVFVLTEQHHAHDDTSLDVSCFSTKNEAKAELLSRKDEVLDDYREENGNAWEVYVNQPTIWGISSTDRNEWTELVITERRI